MKRISILFENEQCIVVNKPAGLPVQGGARVGASLDKLLEEARSPKPLLVHRLDKDTSGLILAAKNRAAAAVFSALFSRNRGVCKHYLGVCAGRPKAEAGTIDCSLVIRGEPKRAQTSYTRLAGDRDCSLLALELGTGRMHQIRRHLAQMGNPLLGDDKYGNFALNKGFHKSRGLTKLLLHAARLVIPQAEGLLGFPLDVSAPLPAYFQGFIERFKPADTDAGELFSRQLILALLGVCGDFSVKP